MTPASRSPLQYGRPMTEDTKPSAPQNDLVEPDDGSFDAMHVLERLGAVVLGLAFGVFGIIAVFKSDNQAGTAGLMVAAVAFLLIGVQGTLLVKFGSGSSSVELARRRRRAIEEAKREDNPDVADGILRGAELMGPELPPSSAELAAIYEKRLAQAIQRITGNVTVAQTRDRGGPDLLTRTASGVTVAIDVRYRSRGPLRRQDIDRVTAQAARQGEVGKLVIVTNAPLSGDAEEFNGQFAGKPGSVEVVTWNDESDDGLLGRALGRSAR